MAAYKITEQQFRVRRRDRRMVWVDAVAFLLGLVIVTAGVGGVIFLEAEPQPVEWRYSFIETRHPDMRVCVGYMGGGQGTDANRTGCDPPLDEAIAEEGVPWHVDWGMAGSGVSLEGSTRNWRIPMTNVSSVTFELTWIDEMPLTEENDGCRDYCGRNFVYDQNSTDELLLEVTTPWGETFAMNASNDLDSKAGTIRIVIPVTELEGGTITTFTHREALDELNATYYTNEHRGMGSWGTVVTVLRAGDMIGTVPANVCTEAGMDEDQQGELGLDETCDIYDEWNTLGGGVTGPTGDIGFYPFYNLIPEDLRNELPYTSTYVDPGTAWILKMIVRTYEASVGL